MPNWAVIALVLAVGLVAGVLSPNQKFASSPLLAVAQSATGWAYTLAWSLTFWSQAVLNYTRQDVSGLSFDFLALNMLGWVAYSLFNVAMYYALPCTPGGLHPAAPAGARAFLGAGPRAAELAALIGAHLPPSPLGAAAPPGLPAASGLAALLGGSPGGGCDYAVELNDVVFAVHALLVTTLTVWQARAYPSGGQRVHLACVLGIAVVAKFAAAYALAIWAGWDVGARLAPWMEWVYWAYFLSYVKMGVTCVKYCPQAFMNCRRRSTEGWSLLTILLDFVGGILSLGQQFVTCYWTGNWGPLASNPVKLGLAVITIVFDVVFLAQHWAYNHTASARALARARASAAAAAERRVRAVLRALASAPGRLPFDVEEDALLTLGECGVDVYVPKELQHYADSPEQLPPAAKEKLLGAYWAAGGAAGIAIPGGGAEREAAGGGGGPGGLREPLLPVAAAPAAAAAAAAAAAGFVVASSESGSEREPEVEILLGPAPAPRRWAAAAWR
ncbi:hypothetical protein Rsub_07086 [Raphidocelis subcapitata]|uniref:Cystinosin n=1 Tax=Raphidocelis subcapitata TaxID=307507 RepID=A0A2V0P3D8_9CHLO|nr:hypothetical protein Rsub_07086 [Raphidocelis subcapitata]|eukprot:GBF94099.1 hypothetical protein Rsub_07086 [Raphidocelis subcapitata]